MHSYIISSMLSYDLNLFYYYKKAKKIKHNDLYNENITTFDSTYIDPV